MGTKLVEIMEVNRSKLRTSFSIKGIVLSFSVKTFSCRFIINRFIVQGTIILHSFYTQLVQWVCWRQKMIQFANKFYRKLHKEEPQCIPAKVPQPRKICQIAPNPLCPAGAKAIILAMEICICSIEVNRQSCCAYAHCGITCT